MRSYVNNAKKIGQKLGLDKIERNQNQKVVENE
jgi:hypothetical protein